MLPTRYNHDEHVMTTTIMTMVTMIMITMTIVTRTTALMTAITIMTRMTITMMIK